MYKAYLNGLKSPDISKPRQKEKLTSIINKKTIRYHFNNLIREYNILPEERKPFTIVKHVAKTLFWAAVYLAFSYLTITWAFEVIRQYHGNQTTTQLKAVINNNVTYFPNMTICFKINTSALFNINSSSTFNYMSAWSQFFEETISPEGIFNTNESGIYDDEIYLSLLKYLAMIYEAERAWEPGLTRISTFHSEESDDWIALKEVLVPNIERFNITLEQLKSVLAGKVCSLLEYTSNSLFELAYTNGPSNETRCIVGKKISFIGMDTICLRLTGYQNYLRTFGRTNSIHLDLYIDRYRIWCQESTVDLGSESRSTPRRATTRNETYAYYYYRFLSAAAVYMNIGVRALYRKLPYVKGEIQCSSDTSREECENKCLRGWIKANCHCSPITFNLTTDITHYRNCTVDDYSICLKHYAENAIYVCTNKCVPLCEQWHYEYTLQSVENSFSFIEIGFKTLDYVIIEEVFSCPSFEEFIGALGGALGIWLGLDFLIIIEFIVKLVTQLIKKILLRNVHNSEEDKQRKSAKIGCIEENVENGISSSNEAGNYLTENQKKHKENKSEIAGTCVRQIKRSEKQRTPRKKRQSNGLKEKHEQQRRKRSENNIVESEILDDQMKNIDAHNRRLRNQKVIVSDNVDAVQQESTALANNCSARSWFLQNMIVLLLNGDASKDKRALYLRLVEKLFWATIYLVGSLFTTLWCVQLITLYLADETVYYPSLIKNRTVLLPPPSLCISFNNYIQFERYGNCSDALMEYFGQANFDRASFIQLSDGKDWPKSLVIIGLLYFRILASSEIKNTDVNFTSEYELHLNSLSENRCTFLPYSTKQGYDTLFKDDIDKSINDILLPKLLEWNITTNELRQKLGADLARVAELKITFTNSNGTIDIVKDSSFYTAAISHELVCYSLSFELNFTDPDDTLEILIKGYTYPVDFKLGPGYILLSDFLLDNEDMAVNIYAGVP